MRTTGAPIEATSRFSAIDRRILVTYCRAGQARLDRAAGRRLMLGTSIRHSARRAALGAVVMRRRGEAFDRHRQLEWIDRLDGVQLKAGRQGALSIVAARQGGQRGG